MEIVVRLVITLLQDTSSDIEAGWLSFIKQIWFMLIRESMHLFVSHMTKFC
jgi:hypothetical protein